MGRLTEAIRTFLPLKFREKASSVCNNDDTSVVSSHCTYAKNPEEYRRVNAMKSQQVKKKGVEEGKGGVKYVRLCVVYKREKNVGALVCLAV